MSNPEPSLPDAWVERIFSTMRATYGAAFDRQWECPAGVDPVKFLDVMNSFGVQSKARQATALSAGYRVDGTPTLGIDGRWFTSGSLEGSNEGALQVADYLIALARKAA